MAIKNPKITECPEYLSRWDFEKNTDKNPEDFVIGSNKKAFWKCKFGHSYERSIQNECIR